jgi:hypothetical protein
LFLDNERYDKILRKWRKLRYCERITSHWLRNITGVLKDKMSWRLEIRRNLLKVVQAKMMIQTFVITARRRSCLMFWKPHVNIWHKRTRGNTLFSLWFSKTFSLSLSISKSFSFQSWKLNWKRSIATLLDK